MFIIRDREAGNRIEAVETYEEALELVEEYEEEDKRDGSYTEDFYEIVKAEAEILFGDFDRDGLEVGINENGKLYVADARNIEYADDTPENREEFIEDAKNTLEIWKRERLGRIPQELWYVTTNGSILTDGKKIAIIEMYTWKDGNTSNDYSPEFFEAGSLAPVLAGAGREVCVGNTPVKEVDDVDECIANARQWADAYEPVDGEEAYADIDEIEITW